MARIPGLGPGDLGKLYLAIISEIQIPVAPLTMKDRSRLPFRKNCEGYFFDNSGNVLAREMENFLALPGGGVDENEDIEKALIREALEEAGAIVKNLKKVAELKFVYGPNWAKTEKQRKRYKIFKGEDMHFFCEDIEKFEEPYEKEEDFWNGKKLMPITKAIRIIESKKPFDKYVKEYREIQLKYLKTQNCKIKKNLS